jgi:hypothetical protein
MNAGRHVCLHLIQYPREEYWYGIKQMAQAREPLASVKDLHFSRMLGTGGGRGYGFLPDLGTYALLCSWPSAERAQEFMANHPVFQGFRAHSSAIYTIHMEPISSRGRWTGSEPFTPVEDAGYGGPLAVITRATLRPHYMIPFWLSVAGVVRSYAKKEGLVFTKGLGDLPWVMQATFSVWSSLEEMTAFAHARGTSHQKVIARTRRMNGFSEELYARFKVLGTEGSWHGTDPIREKLGAALLQPMPTAG